MSGHLVCADLGIAVKKKPKGALKGKIGTPGYWAPEIFKGEPYGTKSDFFTFGVVLYEMLVGYNPFLQTAMDKGCHPNDVVMGKHGELEYPDFLSEDAKTLIQAVSVVDSDYFCDVCRTLPFLLYILCCSAISC